MTTYEYKGFETTGRVARGLIEAVDLKEARERLAARGILADRLRPAGQRDVRWLPGKRNNRVSVDARAALYRELAALLKAGLPVAQAMDVIISTPEYAALSGELAAARDQVREGHSLARALAALGGASRPMEQAAMEVGEHSGSLGPVLEQLAGFLEEQDLLRERIVTALIYPCIVITVAVLLAVIMLGVMMPRFARMFEDARLELPALTKAMLALGDSFMALMVVGLVLLLGGLWLFRLRLRQSAALRLRYDQWLFRLPLAGQSRAALANLRFARTMSLLLQGGVSLVEAMMLAARATGSCWIEACMNRESEAVRQGSSLADALRRVPPLSGALPGWIRAGEASGELVPLLENAAQRFFRQWNRSIARSMQVMEPALMILVGVMVLLLALAILMPIMSLNQGLM
jgi:general secretion pathway protein F